MRIEKLYTLYQITLEQGKRMLIYNKTAWEIVYLYEGKLICRKSLSLGRYLKAVLKYHHLEDRPDMTKPMIHIEIEGK